ncbi:MAG: hypothetical protein PHP11_00140 [Erysipelotrichaceae bacterium]|nr:hypothetical protein [Erysipelotrichaceae bacterium]
MDNKQGFILINGLIIMAIVSSFVLSLSFVSYRYLLVLKDYQKLYERLELERIVINKINQEYYDFENRNFTMTLYDSEVNVIYDDLDAKIVVSGKYNFVACLVYNDPYGTIESYEYTTNCFVDNK